MLDTFTFNSISSSDFGVYVLNAEVNNAPKKVYDTVSIDGRSGDLHIDRNRFENVVVPYTCTVYENADADFDGLMAALLSSPGDSRLTDTIHTDYFRKATFKGGTEPKVDRRRSLAVFTLEFDCAPQKWLTSGEVERTISGSALFQNPTRFASKPLIKVTGTGRFGVGGRYVVINSNPNNRMVIDCESQDVYDSQTYENLNGSITLQSGEFPEIPAGESAISLNGATLAVTPRWWTV